ncbi:MAG: hypothetical protein C4K60_10015 [Ideonella sp. MAG2]|nr:MAG: hypothetical protein C4K60_10015 [Ideonella sp. MAG2]
MTRRSFALGDQIEFALLSRDFNPIHVDPIASRRLIYGQPVVHGVNAMLWALSEFAAHLRGPVQLQSLTCAFTKPVLLNEEVSILIDAPEAGKAVLRLRQLGQVVAKVSLACAPHPDGPAPVFQGQQGPATSSFSPQPDQVNEADLPGLQGEFALAFDTTKALTLYGPALFASFGSQVIAEITALTKVVGMHAPGLNSLFTEIQLKPASAPRVPDQLRYQTQDYDQRFHQLVVACHSHTFDARLKAFYRPAAVAQAPYAALKRSVSDQEFASQRALIVGGSRGLGEVTAKYLAAGGARVMLTYSRGAADASAIVSDITSQGGQATAAAFDLSSFTDESLGALDDFAPTDIYYFATPFIFSGKKDVFSGPRLQQFMDFYLLGFHRLLDRYIQRGTKRYFCPSSVALDEMPAAMGEYCVAKAAAEAYCEWVVRNRPGITITHPRLPRLATDQTASIAAADNGDTALMLQLLRDFSLAGRPT